MARVDRPENGGLENALATTALPPPIDPRHYRTVEQHCDAKKLAEIAALCKKFGIPFNDLKPLTLVAAERVVKKSYARLLMKMYPDKVSGAEEKQKAVEEFKNSDHLTSKIKFLNLLSTENPSLRAFRKELLHELGQQRYDELKPHLDDDQALENLKTFFDLARHVNITEKRNRRTGVYEKLMGYGAHVITFNDLKQPLPDYFWPMLADQQCMKIVQDRAVRYAEHRSTPYRWEVPADQPGDPPKQLGDRSYFTRFLRDLKEFNQKSSPAVDEDEYEKEGALQPKYDKNEIKAQALAVGVELSDQQVFLLFPWLQYFESSLNWRLITNHQYPHPFERLNQLKWQLIQQVCNEYDSAEQIASPNRLNGLFEQLEMIRRIFENGGEYSGILAVRKDFHDPMTVELDRLKIELIQARKAQDPALTDDEAAKLEPRQNDTAFIQETIIKIRQLPVVQTKVIETVNTTIRALVASQKNTTEKSGYLKHFKRDDDLRMHVRYSIINNARQKMRESADSTEIAGHRNLVGNIIKKIVGFLPFVLGGCLSTRYRRWYLFSNTKTTILNGADSMKERISEGSPLLSKPS